MRFPDTLDGWNEQLLYLTSKSQVRNYLRAMSKSDLVVVRNRKKGVTSQQPAHNCHNNVDKLVKRIGGQAIFGWYIYPYMANDKAEFDGMIIGNFHCNWLTPENELVNVTAEDGAYHLFLPDNHRKFDFDTKTSYNNRVIYLDNYNPPSFAINPSRNVTYFRCKQYQSRDRLFEKYTIPKSITEAVNSLPDRMKRIVNGRIQLTDEGKQWLHLRFAVSLPDD
jgi:hypothetical protein